MKNVLLLNLMPNKIETENHFKNIFSKLSHNVKISFMRMESYESKNIDRKFNILLDELKKYNTELLDKEKILAVTKCDLIDKEKIDDIKSNHKLDFMNIDVHFISSVTQMGLKTLKDSMWKKLNI